MPTRIETSSGVFTRIADHPIPRLKQAQQLPGIAFPRDDQEPLRTHGVWTVQIVLYAEHVTRQTFTLRLREREILVVNVVKCGAASLEVAVGETGNDRNIYRRSVSITFTETNHDGGGTPIG